MRTASVIALALVLSACGWSGFEPRDRELSSCWPRCGDDAALVIDAGFADASVDAMPSPDAIADAEPARPDAIADAGEHDPDTGTHDDAEPELFALEAIYSTPNSITFVWDPARVPANAEGFVLRSGALTWDAEDDGNLAYRISPHGPGSVSRTTITGLTPNTMYTARLFALIPVEGERAIAEGSGRTIAVPGGALELFAEELHGEAMRTGFQDPLVAARAHAGTRALWLTAGEVEINASLSNLALAPPSVTELRFSTAYLELFIYVQFAAEPVPTYFQVASLSGGDGHQFTYSYLALPARSEWIRVQLAVEGFSNESAAPLTLAGLGATVFGFGISGAWPQGATVFVDDVVLRY